MKRSVVVLMAAAFLGGCGGKSEALKVFRQFSAAQREGKCDVLLSLAADNALEEAERFCAPAGKLFGNELPSAASMAADMASTPAGAMSGWKTELESSAESGGDLILQVVQKPTGQLARKSTFNRPPPPRQLTVIMSKASGSWKVKEVVQK